MVNQHHLHLVGGVGLTNSKTFFCSKIYDLYLSGLRLEKNHKKIKNTCIFLTSNVLFCLKHVQNFVQKKTCFKQKKTFYTYQCFSIQSKPAVLPITCMSSSYMVLQRKKFLNQINLKCSELVVYLYLSLNRIFMYNYNRCNFMPVKSFICGKQIICVAQFIRLDGYDKK